MKRTVAFLSFTLGLTCLTQPALAQKKSRPKPAILKPVEPPIPAVCPLKTGETLVTIITSKGNIEVAADTIKAPITAGNFLGYVDSRKMDGARFYRSVRMGDTTSGEGLIQAGQADPKKLLPPIAHEPTNQTGFSNVKGAISMARGAPGTATSDFFIMTSDLTSLDADPAKAGDNVGYAVFGRVTKGMDVVNAIHMDPIDPLKGNLIGQMLANPIEIIRARRTPLFKADDPACIVVENKPAAAEPALK